MSRLRIPVLFASAFFGIFVAKFAAPTWVYDHFSLAEAGAELLRYRALHSAVVYGVSVSLFTLIAAHVVGSGVSSTIAVSTLSVVFFIIAERVYKTHGIDILALIKVVKFLPMYLFSAFSTVGVWYFVLSLKVPKDGASDA